MLYGGGPDRRASCTVRDLVEVEEPVRAAGEAGVPAGARDGSRSRPPRRWPPAGSDGEKAVRHVDAALGGGLGGCPGRRGIWDAHRQRWGGRGGSRGGCLRTCTGRARPCFGAPPPTPEKCGCSQPVTGRASPVGRVAETHELHRHRHGCRTEYCLTWAAAPCPGKCGAPASAAPAPSLAAASLRFNGGGAPPRWRRRQYPCWDA